MKKINFNFQIQLTSRCNLNCTHCYLRNEDSNVEIEPKHIVEWVNGAAEVISNLFKSRNCDVLCHYHLAGGEPFLYKQLNYVVGCLANSKSKVNILSNGVSRNNFASVDWNKISDVQISVDGLEKAHDWLRGGGSFEKAIDCIRVLVANNVQVSTNCTILKHNVQDIEAYIDFVKNLGVNKIGFKRYIPTKKDDGLDISIEEFVAVKKVISNYAYTSFDDPLCHIIGSSCSAGGCSAGFWGLTILANGDIWPCSKVGIKIGNIKTDTFAKIWFKSDVLKKLRVKSNYTTCSKCDYWNLCRGCRAYVFAKTGNLFSHDTYCSLQSDPQVFTK